MQHGISQNSYSTDDNLGNSPIFLFAFYFLGSFMPSLILVFSLAGLGAGDNAEEYYTVYIILAIDFNKNKARTNNACFHKSSSQTVTS